MLKPRPPLAALHARRCSCGRVACAGAGEGNRTLVCSLGSCRSAIELHPRAPRFYIRVERYHCAVIHVTVNGAAQRFEAPLDVASLLKKLDMAGKKIAVEKNGEIVPKSAHAGTLIADGDQLEIVVAVGGG